MSDVEIFEDAIEALALSRQVQDDMEARMDQVVAVAKATAPVLTGDYQESIHRVKQPDADGTVHVDTDVHYAIYVEHGTRQTDRNGRSIHPPRYNLSHALDAAGGDHDV
ncbi:HK97 gp10 family phage protein [Streptomyces sp. NPDC058653]|uniref:HK97 gp10 family phage protein n=1 Tax=Streptomyces sp. NPDC058653 TaxID=3346576 RepID=UPI0036568D1D